MFRICFGRGWCTVLSFDSIAVFFSPFLFNLVSNCPAAALSALVDFCLGPAAAPGALVGYVSTRVGPRVVAFGEACPSGVYNC